MRSPGHRFNFGSRRLFGAAAVAVALLASSFHANAQPAPKTRIYYGTRLIEPESPPAPIVEPVPMPREFDIRPREPERLPPIQIQLQQPPATIDPLPAWVAEMGHARRIDRLEDKTDVIQKELEKQSIRHAANAEAAVPKKLPESALSPASVVAATEKAPDGNVKIEVNRSDLQPSFTTMVFTQLAAIVGSIVIVTILFFGAHLLLVRHSGGGLGSLFKIELIGTHAPSAGAPLPSPEPKPEPWGEVTPNFDIGPTYEEHRQQAEEAERNKERALLQHIFKENQKMQDEIRTLPADAETEIGESQIVETK